MFDSSAFLASVSRQAGVYRMYNSENEIIYVGKAKNLHKRLASYFRKRLDNEKTKALVSHIAHIDVTVTHTETEALILEHNYIKQYKPKYNVLLRDDKSYPYLLLTKHKHPKLAYHRGAKKRLGEYFGPYPDAGAVRETLHLLQKIFKVRQCEDSVYANRTRPCLMYQIERCLGPCVKGLISDDGYQQQVDFVRLFLQGKDSQVLESLIQKMEAASQALRFEEAASLRDQIQAIRQIQTQQAVSDESQNDLDVIGFAKESGSACIHLLMIRQGRILGSRSFFPKVPHNTQDDEVFESFLEQYYLSHSDAYNLPQVIVFDASFSPSEALGEALTDMAGRKVSLQGNSRGVRARYLRLATTNASSALASKISHKMTMRQRLKSLEALTGIDAISRMECFDISHTMGENTVASCVVFNQEGPVRQEYRRYNITGITGGDDYAAMAQVLTKRYQKQLDVDKIPDIIFIDGGMGQLSRAHEILTQCWQDWPRRPLLIGVAKGEGRKFGLETLFKVDGSEYEFSSDSPALHLVGHIRDQSHDHAIAGHRAKRGKARQKSVLEDVAGIGPKRRQALLKYMGGLQGLKKASVADIQKVPGISESLAHDIYAALKD